MRYAHITAGWLAFLGSLVALALFDPAVASGIARISLVLIAFAGFALIVYLSTHGFDRAVLLIPTWFLLVVWVIAAGMTVGGSVTNDIVGHRFARRPRGIVCLSIYVIARFAGGGATTGIVSDIERRALALTGSGDLIWTGTSPPTRCHQPETESLLGVKRGTLEGPAANGSRCCIRSQTAPRRVGQACSTSAGGRLCRISACARPMAISWVRAEGHDRWSAPTAKSCAWSERYPTSPDQEPESVMLP